MIFNDTMYIWPIRIEELENLFSFHLYKEQEKQKTALLDFE